MTASSISRRTALKQLAAVPVTLALAATLPAPIGQAAPSAPSLPAVWPVTIVWHQPLTADDLHQLRRVVTKASASLGDDPDGHRVEIDRWGHVTLTWSYDDRWKLADLLAGLYQILVFKRAVGYTLTSPPMPDPDR